MDIAYAILQRTLDLSNVVKIDSLFWCLFFSLWQKDQNSHMAVLRSKTVTSDDSANIIAC